MLKADPSKIGQRIKKLRIERGLTQNQLSEMVEYSNTHLSHVETGQNQVSLNLLLQLSCALEISLDYFLLDTPYARPEAVIDFEISQKLERCSAPTLLAVNQMIDILLEQQKNLSE